VNYNDRAGLNTCPLLKKINTMTQKEDMASTTGEEDIPAKHNLPSKRVSDHLANERTFLAWVRTGLATITFGFVVERFGLLLRELGLRSSSSSGIPAHYSSIFGVALTVLGVIMMIVALLNFLHNRASIEKEDFHPHVGFAVLLTIIASLVGILLAIYLVLTG
jgi:putative membrane protein